VERSKKRQEVISSSPLPSVRERGKEKKKEGGKKAQSGRKTMGPNLRPMPHLKKKDPPSSRERGKTREIGRFHGPGRKGAKSRILRLPFLLLPTPRRSKKGGRGERSEKTGKSHFSSLSLSFGAKAETGGEGEKGFSGGKGQEWGLLPLLPYSTQTGRGEEKREGRNWEKKS